MVFVYYLKKYRLRITQDPKPNKFSNFRLNNQNRIYRDHNGGLQKLNRLYILKLVISTFRKKKKMQDDF